MKADTIDEALRRMRWSVEPDEFCLVGFAAPPTSADLALLGSAPSQLIREEGETSMLVRFVEVDALRARHPHLESEGPLLWVRFEAAMGWEVVGFLARVTTALAERGIPIGAVCGFSRDHLFIHVRFREAALEALGELFPRVDA